MLTLMVFEVAGTNTLDTDHAVARSVCDALAGARVHAPLEQVSPVMGVADCGLVEAMLSERTRPVMDRFPTVHAVSSLLELLPLVDQHKVEIAG